MVNDTYELNELNRFHNNENLNYIDKMRIVIINNNIDNNEMLRVINRILYLDNISHNPIIMQICSDGGDVFSGLTIIDIMNSVESPIYTIALGKCHSIASLILSAGEKGHRKANKNCLFILHRGTTYIQGGTGDILEKYHLLLELDETVLKIYSNNCQISLKEIKKRLNKEIILNTEQAIEFGLVDEVI